MADDPSLWSRQTEFCVCLTTVHGICRRTASGRGVPSVASRKKASERLLKMGLMGLMGLLGLMGLMLNKGFKLSYIIG